MFSQKSMGLTPLPPLTPSRIARVAVGRFRVLRV